jgi:tetratricopeptide (TPR) repeat protein
MTAALRERLQAELADRYRLDRELGRGGMAIVFLAHDLKHDRAVALKVLRPELFASLGTGRFLREIKLAASLAHPHIVPLYDSGAAGGVLYYVMPYLTGESLRDRLTREGKVPLADAVRIAREVADALDYAHRSNIVHRDVKPENILIQDDHAMVADFGVARAISVAAGSGDRASGTGLGIAVGTPDYMSPEQASASADIDGRSDIYSLGCVLFEMLSGRPPFAGGTPVEQMEAHVGEHAPSMATGLRAIPLEVELAVATALAKRPEDRFQTAAAFASALGDAAVTPSGRWPGWLKRRWWAGLAGAAALGALAVAVLPHVLGAGLDRSRYVVVPFGHRAGAAPALLNGDNCELLLYEAFRRWRDVRVSDDFQVHDALQRLGRPPATLDDARAVARRVGAGLLVWGEVAQVGDSVLVSAAVYDVPGGGVLRKQSVRLGAEQHDFGAQFDALADSLLLGERGALAAAGGVRTPWLAAWRAYADGRAALGEWDLPRAERAFREAIDIDSAFPDPRLWLAQVREWAGASPAEWGGLPAVALASGTLPARDRARGRALLALAEGREPEACAEYDRLLVADSLDFSAWYGLAECLRRDRAVVRDTGSPSGWRFRASLETAISAYSRALRLNPSVHRAFFTRLPDLIFIEPSYVRSGRAAAPDTGRFGAWPMLAGDTLAFVPYPLAALLSGAAGAGEVGSPANLAAVARNRETLREIGRTWVRAFPNSADAHEALGLVLEAAQAIAPASDDDASALAQVRRGRGVATAPLQRLRLGAAEARLLLKLEDYAAARALADSLLRAGRRSTPEPAEAALLAPLAALTGRAGQTAELLVRAALVIPIASPEGEPVDVGLPVAAAGLTLLAHAALGAPRDTIERLERNVERLVEASVRPERRAPVRGALLDVPAVLAFPAAGPRPALRAARDRSYLADLQWRLAQGDTGAVRQRLAAVAAARRFVPPGAVAIDATYNEAWLALGLGDAAGARRRLDAPLTALPTLGNALLTEVPQAAALVRAMGLRAELAAGAGDRERAQWWGRAVVTLWSDADPVLQPFVHRMEILSQ